MSKKRIFVTVTGIVQGVGFRPFVYNLAVSLKINGWVNNNSEGVYIDMEGCEEALNCFLYSLKHNPPPLSRVEELIIEDKEPINYTDFSIKESERKEESITLISPDIATCEDCRRDILDPANRRYRYAFTNCTNCGPRFSIIKSIPYDRDKTTMDKFKMCEPCYSEYTDPSNRRFHAQPNACEECGPRLWLVNSRSELISLKEGLDPLHFAEEKLLEGHIFAIKGLTGFHLVCDANNVGSLRLLRERKKRPHKPFAVMAKNLEVIKKYCEINPVEEKLLTGIRKPIVLLNQRSDYSLSEEIAPGQRTLGVMLPYTPMHELLFNGNIELLIMTSANVYGLPLEYNNEGALKNLSNLVDYFLLHNRDIYIPVDDSVTKVTSGEERMIRRARGYAPEPLNMKNVHKILACGANMKNTFSISKDNFIFISQHNGDLENLETFEHYKRNIEHFKNIFKFQPEIIAHDLHPAYLSTEYAKEYNIPKIPVQHHHAHIASCMYENKINSNVIGISYDGTGYGIDGKIWGGEFLLCSYRDFQRLGHLSYVDIPGGDKAIMEPWRMAVSYIYKVLREDSNGVIEELYKEKGLNLIPIVRKKINSIETSSMGRLFDAVSSIIGIKNEITYEGQASIELEAVIKDKYNTSYSYEINKKENEYIINQDKIIIELLKDKASGTSSEEMSCKFHNTVINFSIDLCTKLRKDTSINIIALSGGVFQNSYLLTNLISGLEKEGFQVISHSSIPTNDGGVSLGQLVIANEVFKSGTQAL